MLERDFERMRAEMDRIERWLARRADKAGLSLVRKANLSTRGLVLLFAAWAVLFIALPAWLLSG